MSLVGLVTGAASGIGRCCALELAQRSSRIFLWDSNKQGLAETAELIQAASRTCEVSASTVDVASSSEVKSAYAQLKKSGATVSRLVAAAGLVRINSLTSQNLQDADLVMRVNYNGVVNVMNEATTDLIEQKGAAVMIGSTESFLGGSFLHSYAASKHALLGFCRSAAMEMGPHQVRVNIVSPGAIKTPMYTPELHGGQAIEMDKDLMRRTPLHRHGRPEEIAKVVMFLLSEDASYVTGANVVADGGLTA